MSFGVLYKIRATKDGPGMLWKEKSGRILAWHNGKRQDRLFGFMEIAAAI
jgi:hypothetical protein